jgi:3'-phosphoadenosine 5'-phosphosulfate (PAPS) 3'-phosphatase
MKTAAAHRAESQRIDDQDQHVSVDERREFHSLISAVSDSGLFRTESSDYQTAHQISKRRDKLAQLRQVLDRLLQHETERHAIWQ